MSKLLAALTDLVDGGPIRRRHAPVMEQRSTIALRQLGIHYGVVDGGLGIASVDEAMRDAATWACIRVKAQALAMLPVDVVRYQGRERIPVPIPKIIAAPSNMVTRRTWLFQAAASMFADGNVFGLVVDVDALGRPSTIELVAPHECRDRKVVDGVPQVRVGSQTHRRYPFGDLWHVPGEVVEAGSPFGLSPVTYGSKSTATSLAAEAFGGKFFTEGAHPSGLITDLGDIDETQARAVQDAFVAAVRGSREPVAMARGTYHPLQVNPEDSQFLDLMNFEVLQTCRRHGVPPSMVYAAVNGQNITYANVSQADLHFLKWTLEYPLTLLEDAQSALLPAPRVVKYNIDAILRADAEARHRVYEARLRNRTATVNEVRALEDEVPFGPEFDIPGVPPMGGTAPAATDDAVPDEEATPDE